MAGQLRGMEVKGLLGVLMDGSYHVCVTWGVSRALGAFLSVLEHVSREPGMSGAACGEGVFLFRRVEGGDRLGGGAGRCVGLTKTPTCGWRASGRHEDMVVR